MTTNGSERATVAWTKVAGPTEGKTGIRFEWSVTVRGDDPSALIEQIKDYEMQLISAGCIPFDAYVDSRREARGQTVPQAIQPTNGKTFTAESLSISINDGKAYYKVKGGNFKQWGVTIWPEALEESGINTEEINPLKPPDIAGLTAHYEEWEHEGKTRRKVTKLA